jgi:hypothetical protein
VLRGSGQSALVAGISALAISSAGNGASAGDLILPGSLVISTTTYQDTGPVSALVAGTSLLPGGKKAVSGGNFATVFNNAGVDGNFGVTSPITVQDINVTSSPGAVNGTLNIDPRIVSTSFSSKSELSLSIANTGSGFTATLIGYANRGAGNLDVANSDTTAFKNTTNPVTQFFAPNPGQTYAFNRAVLAVNANGGYASTQTLAYGGDNGRAAVLAPNGLYYTVGNSNNGSGTPTQLTTTTGLEVVTPGGTPNSTMIDPTFQSISGDKAGKDSNFRGLTVLGGSLYFTKGSGGNGIDTVYTVSNPGGHLPNSGTANAAQISVLPGFPTAPAKTNADYTPFGLFFANPTTLYVADEGTGTSADTSLHAGLQKWSLVNGTWTLDYVLRKNLIGTTYSVGSGGSTWPTVTTIGLRGLAGRVNANGTVTLWGVTATKSASGDNGADPNEVVQITDLLSATLSASVSGEQFSVLDGPVYGQRYGGVAYASPLPSTWTMMLIGLAGLGFVAYRRGKHSTAIAAA